jgi:hypothetical protein
MNREAFEKLISTWLDEPDDAPTRARIDAALRADPSLQPTWDAWRRMESLLRGARDVPGVDWEALAAHLRHACHADNALEAVLDQAPSLHARVDWPRVHARFSAAVTRAATTRQPSPTRRWMASAAALLATAAAIGFLTLMPVYQDPGGPVGVARLAVAPPASLPDGGIAVVRVTLADQPEPEPERFFSIDPVDDRVVDESPDYY